MTKNPQKSDGRKPAVLYLGAQHAREWITPEMNRRLMHYFLDGYNTNRTIRKLVERHELWFVPVANPDGYDWTFQPGQRLWRKNLRDNNGDGQITAGDGVDLNRNLATKWGYDNEGSSPDEGSETYRGPGPNSEPETKAIDSFIGRVGFEFFVNYHSAAELLLYGTGWQVATPTPDDVIYEAMAGDDANPAVPGYDPDISAELYTTNGDTDTHMTEQLRDARVHARDVHVRGGVELVPDDEWEADDCGSGFDFPDDEALVQAEFEKNIPFALSVAKSADDPDDPESAVGRRAENFRVDTFDVSFGDPQTVAVVAKRAIKGLHMHYQIDGGRTPHRRRAEWRGGERYGDENDDYYAEFRGVVRGADRGDKVKVWFAGRKGRGRGPSKNFRYRVARDTGHDVLIIANEDYTGVNPTYPAGTKAPQVRAGTSPGDGSRLQRRRLGRRPQGVPHDLGVLEPLRRGAVVPRRQPAHPGSGGRADPDAVRARSRHLGGRAPAVPDDVGAGLPQRRRQADPRRRDRAVRRSARHQRPVGGLYYGLNGDPTAECVVSTVEGFFEDCLILANDFRQYYLGAYTRTDFSDPPSVAGIAFPIRASRQPRRPGGTTRSTRPACSSPPATCCPPDEFPQFTSQGAAEYPQDRQPVRPGRGHAVRGRAARRQLVHAADQDGRPDGGRRPPQLQFQLSINTEQAYDHVIVEAHTRGQDNWTTLPDLNGGTTTDPPAECYGRASCSAAPVPAPLLRRGGLRGRGHVRHVEPVHRLDRRLARWRSTCRPRGPAVEVSITYVTDPGSGGVGAFVDDTRIVVDGAVTRADGFEGATSTWTVRPAGGQPADSGNWQIGERLLNLYAGTSTEDTLLLGFGLEHLSTDAERADLVRRALGGLLE